MIEFDKNAGQIMKILRTLPDFNLLCLKPFSGKFIKGFGMAYEISGQNMDKLSHINPDKKWLKFLAKLRFSLSKYRRI